MTQNKLESNIEQPIPANDWENEKRLMDFLKEIRLAERKKVIEEIKEWAEETTFDLYDNVPSMLNDFLNKLLK